MSGKKYRNPYLRAIGYGFAGLDLIKFIKNEIFMPGGTCANVMSVLANLGWDTTIIKSSYSDKWNDYIDSIWKEMGVTVKNCSKSNLVTPRVIQEIIENEHFFYTKCPQCQTDLLKITLPTVKAIKESIDKLNYDILYFDRVSEGVRFLINSFNSINKWVFYEPNSIRSYNTFINNAARCDIIKFSDKRIPLSVSNKLLIDLPKIQAKTRIVIITHESNGMSYSLLKNGEYTDYISLSVKPFNNIVDSSGAGDWFSAGFINNFIGIYPEVTNFIDEDAVKSALLMGYIQTKKCCSSIGAIGTLIKNQEYQIPRKNSKCKYCRT
jgi:sugar/nucleoside kinase (ribokinase family)